MPKSTGEILGNIIRSTSSVHFVKPPVFRTVSQKAFVCIISVNFLKEDSGDAHIAICDDLRIKHYK